MRKYGQKPFGVAVIHGGPGAPGEMAPVARQLSLGRGILEPLQTATTLPGQVQELKTVLEDKGDIPMVLIGFSWGAMLSFIFAAQHPTLARKLILIGSGPFEERYALDIMTTRLSRLGDREREDVLSLKELLDSPHSENKSSLLARFGELMFRSDSYEPLQDKSEALDYQYDVYRSVWRQASELRSSGELLRLGERIQCPVVAIHGDYDPHPAKGVHEPLNRVLKDFHLVLLKKCGHYPWLERRARDIFFRILEDELA